MNRHLLTIFTGILFLAHQLKAQDNKTLQRLIINPSALDAHEIESGRSITVFQAKDIEKMAVSSVDELLSSIEGINLNSRGGFGIQTDVGMRGSTFSQVLVLIDNVRVNEGLTGHYNMYLPISLSEIAQIEVIRGPAASAYGADAVGGLVHIKTKNYLIGQQAPTKELGSKGSCLLGENRLRLVDAVVDTKNKDVYVGGSVNVKKSRGQVFSNPNHLRDSTLAENYRTDFDIKNYSLFGNYFLSEKSKIYARASLNTRDFNAKYFYTNSTYDQSVEKINTVWTQVGWQHQGKNQKTQIGLAHKQLNDEFVFNPLFSKNNHTTKSTIGYVQQQRKLLKNVRAAYGIQSVFQQIVSGDRGNHKNNTHAGFISLRYQPIAKLTLNGSARFESNSNYGTSILPQLGVAYQPKKGMVIRSNVGMAHRAPDFTERFISTNLPTLSAGRNLGNPNLKSERSLTGEIGLDLYTKSERIFSVSVFGREGTNLIDYILTNSDSIATDVALAPNANYFYTQNISSAFTYGVEASLQKKFRVSKHAKIRLALNYTFIKTTTENDEPSKYISNHPGHMANLNVGYEAKYIDVMLSNSFRTRAPEDNVAVLGSIPSQYVVSNAVVRLKPYGGKINLVGKVMNIFDTDYQEILGAPMPQRWFAAGLDWKF